MPERSDSYTDLTPYHRRKTKVKVRFPNESYFEEMEINMSDFKPNTEFDDEVFGWYGDVYISIKKEK
jgi:hypothetical protein